VLEAERRKNANLRLRLRALPRLRRGAELARTNTPAECERIVAEEIDHVLNEMVVDPLGTMGPAAPAPEPAVQTPAGATA
jgi:hypothetical protein